MTDDKDEYDDLEPGWDGLAILLWPVAQWFRFRMWLNRKLDPSHPDQL
jgi:hypothetical protein